jgi:hypothetical protein
MLHLHKHFITRGVGLKSVVDIHVFLKAQGATLDRKYLQQELTALGIDDFGTYMEKLARVLLGSEPADKDSKLVADYMADCGIFGSTQNHHVLQMSQTKGKSNTSKKLRYGLRRLFPGVKDMQKHFPSVKRFPWLLPAYWVAHIFKSLFKGNKKRRAVLKDISDEQFDAVGHILTVTGAQK